MPTIAAVDWSGAFSGERSKIWLAVVREDRLVRLEDGRTRAEVVDELCALASEGPLVCGLDFAFSFPSWFLAERGLRSAPELWELAAREGERWLDECPPPFWGRPARLRPPADDARPAFRETESNRLPVAGIAPKSVFQVGGAGSVGTGTIRGLPQLARLRAAGFAIDPFDEPRAPLAYEIYPRYLTGAVNKSSRTARALHMAQHAADQPDELVDRAARSEDAFDAALSALALAACRNDLLRPREPSARERLEGRIWYPVRDPWHPRAWPFSATRVEDP